MRIWDPATGQQRATLTGHTGAVTAVAIAPDGTWLATAGGDGTVRIWDPATGQSVAQMRVESTVLSCRWLEATAIAAGGMVGLYVFDFLRGTVAGHHQALT